MSLDETIPACFSSSFTGAGQPNNKRRRARLAPHLLLLLRLLALLLLCPAHGNHARTLQQRAPDTSIGQLGLAPTASGPTNSGNGDHHHHRMVRRLLQQPASSESGGVSDGPIVRSTTASGCSCLPEWYGAQGQRFRGSCSAQPPPLDMSNGTSGGISGLAVAPWCPVDVATCQRLPYSVRNTRWLYSGRLAKLDWDWCTPAPGECLPITPSPSQRRPDQRRHALPSCHPTSPTFTFQCHFLFLVFAHTAVWGLLGR